MENGEWKLPAPLPSWIQDLDPSKFGRNPPTRNGEWRAAMQLRDPGPEDLDVGSAIMELFSGNAEADSRPMERGTWPMDRF